MPEVVQVARGDVAVRCRVDDEDAPTRLDRWDRRAAAVEEDEVRGKLDRKLRALVDVRDRDRTGEPTATAAAADGLDAGERRRLEVVGRGVSAGARELEQRVDVRRDLRHLGLGWAASSHRDHDDLPVAREQPSGVRRDRRLPHTLAGADDPDRGERERLELRRVETKVGADVRQSRGEHAAREPEALLRAEYRLVREIDDELRPMLGERAIEIVGEDDAVVRVVAQLLGTPHEVRGDELVRELLERRPHDRRIVLSVDEGQSTRHERVVTSSSIRPVYFSYSKVSSENWMIRSCPWKGCLRQTATWLPDTSTTL